MARASNESLDALHGEVAETLREAIKPEPVVVNGEVVGKKYNAAAINAAINFLKANHIEALPEKNTHLKGLIDDLPFPVKPGMHQDEESGVTDV